MVGNGSLGNLDVASYYVILEEHELLFKKCRLLKILHEDLYAADAKRVSGTGRVQQVRQVVALIPGFFSKSDDTGIFWNLD